MTHRLIHHLVDVLCHGVPVGRLRSPHWRAFEKHVIEAHPACSACPTHLHLEVHHIRPFHLYPLLELDPSNVVVLCRRCHFHFGHNDNWKDYNLNVVKDAAANLARFTREAA